MSIFIAFLGSHLGKKKLLADFGLSPFFFEVIDQLLTRSAPPDAVSALDWKSFIFPFESSHEFLPWTKIAECSSLFIFFRSSRYRQLVQ